MTNTPLVLGLSFACPFKVYLHFANVLSPADGQRVAEQKQETGCARCVPGQLGWASVPGESGAVQPP